MDIHLICFIDNNKLYPHQKAVASSMRVVPDNTIMDIENEIVCTVNFAGFDNEWTNFDDALEIFDKIVKKEPDEMIKNTDLMICK